MPTGDSLKSAVRHARDFEARYRKRLKGARTRPKASRSYRLRLRAATMRAHQKTLKAERALARFRRQLHMPLRERALGEASKLIGVMEQGGNNVGPIVSALIRENSGLPGEPWCGDFVAHCYRKAGSHSVTRSWASVWYLAYGRLAGLGVVTNPKAGDIVTYTFSHTGLFVKDNRNGTITCIEGNTGPVGAVSDSTTGSDGVYKKIRSKGLVDRYVRVLR